VWASAQNTINEVDSAGGRTMQLAGPDQGVSLPDHVSIAAGSTRVWWTQPGAQGDRAGHVGFATKGSTNSGTIPSSDGCAPLNTIDLSARSNGNADILVVGNLFTCNFQSAAATTSQANTFLGLTANFSDYSSTLSPNWVFGDSGQLIIGSSTMNGAPRAVIANQPALVTADDGINAYWTSTGFEIRTVPLASATAANVRTIVSNTPSLIQHIASDGTNVYYSMEFFGLAYTPVRGPAAVNTMVNGQMDDIKFASGAVWYATANTILKIAPP
jgi:hypothetical protein